ncbi:unnamed protein product [Discula destructiva]
MDNVARQDPAALGAAMEAYAQKQTGPFSRSGTNATALLSLPGIENEHSRSEVQQLFEGAKAESTAFGGVAPKSFTHHHEDFVKSLLSSPTGASAHYLTFAGFAAVTDDGSMAPPPAGDTK